MSKVLVGFLLWASFSWISAAATDAAVQISSRQPAVIVVDEAAGPQARLAVDRVSQYVGAVIGSTPQIAARVKTPPTGVTIQFLLRPIPYFRPDGYIIEVSREPEPGLIRITAPQASGLKYGAFRLIREMQQKGNEIDVPIQRVRADPHVKTRELFVAEVEWHPTEGEKPELERLHARFDWPHWDTSRLDTYVDLVDWMGYNSLQLMDLEPVARMAGINEREKVTEKIQGMYRRAKANGMKTAFFLWGQSGLRNSTPRNCPRSPAEMDDIRAHWNYLLDKHGALVDRWILHWADPGGCSRNGCTINTPQIATNEFARNLRSRGFTGDVSFSLWALRWTSGRSGAWNGYRDWRSVVDSGILDPGIGINLGRYYTGEIAETIRSQNRKTGVWGWYTNDFETHPALHVHDRILQNEFGRLPGNAGAVLDWYSLEDNNHLLNLPSLYVGAQMLWDPHTSAEQALADFCRSLWDTEGSKVHAALSAVSEVRCGAGEPWIRINWWPDSYMCRLGRGSASAEADLALCDRALQGLSTVRLDPHFVPKMPLLISPEELLALIQSQLQRVRDFAAVRVAYDQALLPAFDGRLAETRLKMNGLPSFSDVTADKYGGGLELFFDKIIRGFANSWKDRSLEDNLAFRASVTGSSYFNGDARFSPQMAVNGILCERTEEGWAADSQDPAWLKIDLGTVKTIRAVRIYNRAYRREVWDNNLTATPTAATVYCSEADPEPNRGTSDDHEPGYRHVGAFESWEPSDNPAAFREIFLERPAPARFVKLVIHGAANGQNPGCGEVEIR